MAKKIKHETKVVELSALKPFENNPNRHPEAQIDAIAKSIDVYGQYYPIIVDENMQVLCGHGKLLALQAHGDTTGEVRIIHGLTDKQKKKLVIEDNKIQSLSFVSFEKVEEIIKEIGDTDIIGFSEDYLNAIINEVKVDNMGVDFSKPAEKPVSNARQVENIPEETREKQDEQLDDIEQGMQTARTMTCPHCGGIITL